MNRYDAAICLTAIVGVAAVTAQVPVQPWPAGFKAAAVASCRDQIVARAEQDYMKRHNLKEVPDGFRQRIVPAIEPFLAVCNCSLDTLEKEFSADSLIKPAADVDARLRALQSGECAPVLTKNSPAGANSQPKPTK